jgi:quinol-cytochrome oxidoreductase complex cytochrome b subunit
MGAVLLPGFAFSALMLVPFFDTASGRSLGSRRWVAVAGFSLLGLVVLLTALALL